MGANSSIEWTHHTFSPWWGCQRVSPGCEHCYAEAWAKRTGHAVWGPKSPRRFFGDKHWEEPLKWNRAAQGTRERRRVFCASMADVFEDRPELVAWRNRLFRLIEDCEWLDWLLLTKRPENMVRMARDLGWVGEWPKNVWAGCTVEDQQRAEERISWIVEVPAAVRFLSCEPLLSRVDLTRVVPYFIRKHLDEMPEERRKYAPKVEFNALTGHMAGPDEIYDYKIDWVIVGGESGGGARAFHYEWARTIVGHCKMHGRPVFVKQAGDKPHEAGELIKLKTRKGGNLDELPEDLRVREFPEVAA